MSFSVKGRRKALLTYITNKLLFLLYLKKSKSQCIKTFIVILALRSWIFTGRIKYEQASLLQITNYINIDIPYDFWHPIL